MSVSWKYGFYFLFMLTCVNGIAQNDHKARFYYERGEQAYNTGHYKDALDHFNKCLQVDAGYYEVYTSRASVKERLGDWPGAVSDYSIYLEKFPDHAEVIFSRGLARYQARQYLYAILDFKKFLTIPTRQETTSIFYRQSAFGGGTDKIISVQGAVKDYVLNYVGLAESKLQHYDSAITYFDSAIVINPAEADYYVHRGLAKQDKNDFDGAEADYRKALQLDKDHALAFYNLGVLLSKSKNSSQEAIEHLNSAIDRTPELPYPYQERAYYRMENGDYTEALQDYNKAIELKGDDVDSWVNRGLVKEKLKDLKGAYNDFTQAIELKENYEKAWFCRGNILSKMNKLTEALEDYSVALLYYPAYAQAYYNRAIIEHRLRKYSEACEDLQKAVSLGLVVSSHFKNKVCIQQEQ